MRESTKTFLLTVPLMVLCVIVGFVVGFGEGIDQGRAEQKLWDIEWYAKHPTGNSVSNCADYWTGYSTGFADGAQAEMNTKRSCASSKPKKAKPTAALCSGRIPINGELATSLIWSAIDSCWTILAREQIWDCGDGYFVKTGSCPVKDEKEW